MDAIQVIRRDHREVEQIFKKLERAGDGAIRTKTGLVRKLVRELSVHAAIEEELLYPALREAGVVGGVLEALEEHHAVKLLLAELDATGPRAPRFDAKLKVLAENVRRHVAEEEAELLPRLARALDAHQRAELGASLEGARRASPTRPHPSAPDEPPGIFVAGAGAALVDRARDAVRDALATLGAVAERAMRQGRGAVRGVYSRAEGHGRDAVAVIGLRAEQAIDGAKERTQELAERATERARGTANGAQRKGRQAAKRVRRTGRRAASAAEQTGRRAAQGARKAGRAVTRGFSGEPSTVH